MARIKVPTQKSQSKKSGPTDAQLASRAILRKAEEARTDLAKFYEFVIRHETTKKPLKPAPHQELLFSFVSHHDRAVVRLPISTSKTFSMAAMTLWLLGNDVTQRGALVGASQAQSKKVLAMVKDYIDNETLNQPLILVFPHLRKSIRGDDPWTQTAIEVERPAGIRDPSLVAVGMDGKIGGSRISWLVGDDMVDDMNTATAASREATQSNFDGRLMSRLDPVGGRAVVCNTPWSRGDLTYHLEKNAGWPTITMDIYGYIRFSNTDASWMSDALDEHIRPSHTRRGGEYKWFRLKKFDPDPQERTPLWPERFSAEKIYEIRYGKSGRGGMLPKEFGRLFLCEPISDDAARCQRDWVERCKLRGMGDTMCHEYNGPNQTYTGIDVAVGKGKRNDKTTLFTIEVFPDGTRKILDIESGRFGGPTIIAKIVEKTNKYKSIATVESNNAQDFIRQFAMDLKKDLVVRSHTTSKANKLSIDFGVESIFTELKNEAWIIPCDADGRVHEEIQQWIDGMLYYQPPPAHTDDHLMACWIARESARRAGGHDPAPSLGRKRQLINSGGF